MIISFSKKFIFIHNYKVAGTSVRKIAEEYQPFYRNFVIQNFYLYENFIVPIVKAIPDLAKNDYIKSLQLRNHSTALEIKNTLSADIFNNYYKFGFVRNPWDWAVSLYFYIHAQQRHKAHKIVKTFKNFDEFIEWRCSEKYKAQFPHLQKEFFADENGKIIVDFVGKIENLEEDFSHITQQLGIKKVNLPHKNKTQHKNYREYYNDHTRKLVEEHFKEDIELFGYDF